MNFSGFSLKTPLITVCDIIGQSAAAADDTGEVSWTNCHKIHIPYSTDKNEASKCSLASSASNKRDIKAKNCTLWSVCRQLSDKTCSWLSLTPMLSLIRNPHWVPFVTLFLTCCLGRISSSTDMKLTSTASTKSQDSQNAMLFLIMTRVLVQKQEIQTLFSP